jgi:hypothetical protein
VVEDKKTKSVAASRSLTNDGRSYTILRQAPKAIFD